MSRIANNPVSIPSGVDVNINGQVVSVKGPKGTLELNAHPDVEITKNEDTVTFKKRNDLANALAGTMRALVGNMVKGVSEGFERRLTLIGVGYRAQLKGNLLNLTLGFSHPVEFAIPEGIKIETPSQTEIVITGSDKQSVGQVAANIRALRPPEVYKGKGVRYSDEQITLKETKK